MYIEKLDLNLINNYGKIKLLIIIATKMHPLPLIIAIISSNYEC